MSIRALDANAPDAVFAFLESMVSARGRDHWRWKYRLGVAESPSAFYWQDEADRVLGFIGLMRTTLHSAQQRHPAAWFVDWHVAPGEKSVGVGLGLLRKAEAGAGILLTLQGSPDTRQILPRLGWKQSLSPTTWVRPLSRRFVSAWAARQVPQWLRGAAHLGGAAAGTYFRCRRPVPPPDLTLVDVERFPGDYDQVWQVRAGEFAPAMARDSNYVNYLCADYPGRGYHLQMARWRGETLGHLLLRADTDERGFRRGRIVDLLWPRSRPEFATWLVRSGCWQLQRMEADYVECVVSVPDLAQAVRRSRFRARGPVPVWYHRLPAGVPEPDCWYVSFLDCDRAYR